MPGKGRQTALFDVPECMVFRPTMDEFHNFAKYMEYMESKGAHIAGIAKIIPPAEWQPRKIGYDVSTINLTIEKPIKQTFSQIGEKRAYQTKSTSKEPMSVKEFAALAESHTYKTPMHKSYDDLERKYWKSLLFVPPIYGADVADSITDPDCDGWNVANLESILNIIGEETKQEYKGVTTPYLYFGMWKTTFSWHVEDMDLYSINFLHFGAPKTWYCVPPKYGYLLEKAARTLFPNVASWCSNFLRHKTCLIAPNVLDEFGVPYQKVVQEDRNMIIVYPYAYHAGFNHGFNCAESTNFALPRWIEYGKRVRPCDCSRNMVNFNMDIFVKRFQPELYDKWIKGQDIAPHPEDPPEVAREIRLQAENPEAYAAMMKERYEREQEEKAEKLFFITTTGRTLMVNKKSLEFVRASKVKLNEQELNEFRAWQEEMKTNVVLAQATAPLVSEDRRLVHVYQHVTLSQIKVKVFPQNLKAVGEGFQALKEALPLEHFSSVKELIDRGLLIKVGERLLKRKSKFPEIKSEPKREIKQEPIKAEIKTEPGPVFLPKKKLKVVQKKTIVLEEKPVHIYKHVFLDIEAVVDPETLTFHGEQSKELMEFIQGKDFKELVDIGLFSKILEETIQVEKEIFEEKEVLEDSPNEEEANVPCDKYNIYRDNENGKEIVINPETLKQPDITPLETISLKEGETIESLVKSKRLEIITENKKFKRGIKYFRSVATAKVYKHCERDFEILVNARTKKMMTKGRPRKEISDYLEGRKISQLISDGTFVFLRQRDVIEYFQDRNSKSLLGFKKRGPEDGKIPTVVNSNSLIVDVYDVKKCDTVKKVDVAILGNSKTLYRFKLANSEDINSKNESLFVGNDFQTLHTKGVLVKSKEGSINDIPRLKSILGCELKPVERFRYTVKGTNEQVVVDEAHTKTVKRLGVTSKELLSQKSINQLIEEGYLINKEIVHGFVGAIVLKRLVLGLESLKGITVENFIEVYKDEQTSRAVIVKNKRDKEMIVIKIEEHVNPPYQQPAVEVKVEREEFDEPMPKVSEAKPLVKKEEPADEPKVIIKEERSDLDDDDDDYDDVIDSDLDISEDYESEDHDSSEESSVESDISSDDPDFVSGKTNLEIFTCRYTSKKRRVPKKLVKKKKLRRRRGQKKLKIATGKSRNLLEYSDLAQKILEHFTEKVNKAFEEKIKKDITFTIKSLASEIDVCHDKIPCVVHILTGLGITVLVEKRQTAEDNLYRWKGTEGEHFEEALLDILNDSGVDLENEWNLVKDIMKFIIPLKGLHSTSINEIVCSVNGKTSMNLQENINIYVIVSVLSGLILVHREFTSLNYIGPGVYPKLIEAEFEDYKEEFELKKVGVAMNRIDVPDSVWEAYHDYTSQQRLAMTKEIMGPATEMQKLKAAETGLCQCGTQVAYKGKAYGKFIQRRKVTVGQRKRRRCMKCRGCLADRCNKCFPCLRPALKKPCIRRICLFPQAPLCPCFA